MPKPQRNKDVPSYKRVKGYYSNKNPLNKKGLSANKAKVTAKKRKKVLNRLTNPNAVIRGSEEILVQGRDQVIKGDRGYRLKREKDFVKKLSKTSKGAGFDPSTGEIYIKQTGPTKVKSVFSPKKKFMSSQEKKMAIDKFKGNQPYGGIKKVVKPKLEHGSFKKTSPTLRLVQEYKKDATGKRIKVGEPEWVRTGQGSLKVKDYDSKTLMDAKKEITDNKKRFSATKKTVERTSPKTFEELSKKKKYYIPGTGKSKTQSSWGKAFEGFNKQEAKINKELVKRKAQKLKDNFTPDERGRFNKQWEKVSKTGTERLTAYQKKSGGKLVTKEVKANPSIGTIESNKERKARDFKRLKKINQYHIKPDLKTKGKLAFTNKRLAAKTGLKFIVKRALGPVGIAWDVAEYAPTIIRAAARAKPKVAQRVVDTFKRYTKKGVQKKLQTDLIKRETKKLVKKPISVQPKSYIDHTKLSKNVQGPGYTRQSNLTDRRLYKAKSFQKRIRKSQEANKWSRFLDNTSKVKPVVKKVEGPKILETFKLKKIKKQRVNNPMISSSRFFRGETK